VIASFDNYSEAESAVDYLSDRGFAVERVAIIGRDVELVEQVLGRMNYGGAALRGALSGALPGALIGWLFGLFDWIRPLIASLTLAAYGLLFGAVVGAVCGLVWHALQRGRRDFASIQSMQPARYEIVADVDVAEEAVWMLAARDEGGSS
jgi:uncharacterized protein YqgC (DUF456 family)